ncbi:MAG: hypothetical protein HXY52_06615 [Nitrospirae bacterium]|jgi:hypothetical protein|nr:hypothetical protein [Nitrospirota bacterium]
MKSLEKQQKQHYEKPMLRQIELVAEEILAVGCKSLSTGTAPKSATPPCMIRHCAGKGS